VLPRSREITRGAEDDLAEPDVRITPVPQRLLIVFGALAVGALFAAGLFVHGRVGGGLLVATDAILIGLTRTAWAQLRTQGRPLRIAIIAAIAVLAVVKLVKG
jgi:hypothetical protein